ncbi:error-prone DNA polymerase [Nitratireductor luteus]|uniref:error-prone DNA polymerase n=1 Tax=Nitratireductor luteus TaxID=2976980 RepID=UPI00223EC0B7|nr:error-prone DNA polymerase [Nitratireductor luteus]
MKGYGELAAATNFSFLRGASHPQEMVLAALLLGHTGIGIADRNTVAGVVRAYGALEDLKGGELPAEKMREGSGPGEYVWIEHPDSEAFPFTLEAVRERARRFKLAVGARLVFCDGTPDILAYPENREGWATLCRLLTLGNLRAEKADCILRLDDLLSHCRSLLLAVMPELDIEGMGGLLKSMGDAAPGAVWLAAPMLHQGGDRRRLARLKAVAGSAGVPLLAVNDALYHAAEQRDLQDILTCIREGTTIESAGRLLLANAERHLKTPEEMVRLFRDCPEAIAETQYLMQRLDFSLGELKYEYPDEPIPPGRTPEDWLEELTWRRAEMRYPQGIPDKVRRLLKEELALIGKLEYARYFLTIYDIVQFAENNGILCQGRGSAANSAVCYALGITAVDPAKHELLFARFISDERKEPPDIDIDFEHERREEVIQYIYRRYGRHRAGIAATVIHYRPKSAIREVGKALGLSEDVTARIAGTVWGSWGSDTLPDNRISEAGLDPANPAIRRAADFAARLLGFPRHLSQHVGGFVLARGRLDEMVPIGNAAMEERTFIEWDKDDIDRLGMMKVDVLALGMLTCIRKAFDLIEAHYGQSLDLATVEQEDGEVYRMLQRGDSIGVFQVESRAQINMLPRLKPETFYDLVIQVAIVRPGPIQGDMVHPYLRRRDGEELDYPSPAPPHDPDELRNVLIRTLGVPLFQEQAMKIAMVAAEFSDAEANQLRKAMATFRNNGTIGKFEKMMVERMVQRGYKREFAERCFNQIKGFGEYGFPESHAASFAKLVYVSAWIKCHHPEVFACALLNSQPMGFYAPAQIVRDAREHDAEVRAVDINESALDNTLEPRGGGPCALRLGFRQIDGFHDDWAGKLTALRGGGYESVEDLWRRTRLPHRALRLLADADAMRSVGLDRREALWQVRRLPDDAPLPLFAAADERELAREEDVRLPDMALSEHVVADYQTIRLSLKAHPMQFLRSFFEREGIVSCAGLSALPDGAWARVAGIVLVRQRPGNGKAIFMTLEDETGIANALIWARRFERFRRPIMSARLALVEGRVQKSKQNVVHLMATAVHDRTGELDRLSAVDADEAPSSQTASRHGHPRNVRIMPKSRDFH